MKFISRLNKSTNLVEAIAQESVTVETIETTSRLNSNQKPYGFVHGRTEDGALLTGIAYKATADVHGNIATGTTIMLEALASDVAAGSNNKWQLALPQATAVTDAAKQAAAAFLASLS